MLEVGYVVIYAGFDKTPFCWHFISTDCNYYHRFLLSVWGIKPYHHIELLHLTLLSEHVKFWVSSIQEHKVSGVFRPLHLLKTMH